jgi:hypothetical protein
MTAAAMIVGMLPMAIGAPGEEQNAVLARAVIGGVAIGTVTTLLFVPYLYSVIGKFERRRADSPQPLTLFGDSPLNDIYPKLEENLIREPEQRTVLDLRVERRRHRTARLLGLGTLASLGLPVGESSWQHANRAAATIATLDAARTAVPVVRVAVVKADDGPLQIDLPGTIQAFDSATLFARATGYSGRRDVDIGSRVHAGDVLAVISAPELDQQLAQARA